MGKIALSYRRADAQAMAYRIFEHLERHFGEGEVFIDMDIPLGEDFQQFIGNALRQASVLIVVIGPRWVGARKRAQTRIMEETDPVRIEIEAAREQHLRIVPLLVEGAVMPKPTDLPDSLNRFPYLNAKTIDSGFDFRSQMSTVIRSLESYFAAQSKVSPSPPGHAMVPGDFHGVQDDVEAERHEQERLAAEAARKEQESFAAEAARNEQERLAAEATRKEQERLAAEAARKEQERLAAEAERKEQERLAAEAARKEQERLAAEAARKDRQRVAADAARREREFLAAVAAQNEQNRLEAARKDELRRFAAEAALIERECLAAEAARRVERADLRRRLDAPHFAAPPWRELRRRSPEVDQPKFVAALNTTVWQTVNDNGWLRMMSISLIFFFVVALSFWVVVAFTNIEIIELSESRRPCCSAHVSLHDRLPIKRTSTALNATSASWLR